MCTGVLSEEREGWGQTASEARPALSRHHLVISLPTCYPSQPGENKFTDCENRAGLHLGARLVPILSSVGGRMLPVAGRGLPCRNQLLGNSSGPKTQQGTWPTTQEDSLKVPSTRPISVLGNASSSLEPEGPLSQGWLTHHPGQLWGPWPGWSVVSSSWLQAAHPTFISRHFSAPPPPPSSGPAIWPE